LSFLFATFPGETILVLVGLIALSILHFRKHNKNDVAEKRRYQLVVDMANEGVWILDMKKGIIDFVNPFP
jgi:PAS domain-containing protein